MAIFDLKTNPLLAEVAELVLQEHDHDKALELAEELIRALDSESRRPMDQVKA